MELLELGRALRRLAGPADAPHRRIFREKLIDRLFPALVPDLFEPAPDESFVGGFDS